MHNLEKEERVKVGITHGDADEYSYQVLARGLSESAWFDMALPFAYGQASLLSKSAKQGGFNDLPSTSVKQWADIKGKRVLVWETEPSPFAAIQAAVAHLKKGDLKSIVTLPMSSELVKKDYPGFKTTAHFLSSQIDGSQPFKMYLQDQFRWSFLTSVKMDQLQDRLGSDKIWARIRALYKVLQSDFSITCPRIAILSMNPDLESTELCEADKQILQPITASLIEQGKPIFGPYSPKVFFAEKMHRERAAFHAVLCMFKEQLDPWFEQSNTEGMCAFTAGLPVVHIEPLYEVGKSSLEQGVFCLNQALYFAIDIEKSRSLYARINANPLSLSDKRSDNEGEV